MSIPPPGPPLTPDAVELSRTLPRTMDPVTLIGQIIELAPLDPECDTAPLHAVSNGQPATLGDRTIGAYDAEEQIWRFMHAGPFPDKAALGDYLRGQAATTSGLCLCVRARATGAPIGVVNYMNNFPEHLKVELGGIWYSPLAQRTNANLEATNLMLRHAFALGYRRVEWKCDALNLRSRRAAERMGFRFEGIQEAHFIVKGRNRDTAWFRILDHEWPTIRAQHEQLLAVR